MVLSCLTRSLVSSSLLTNHSGTSETASACKVGTALFMAVTEQPVWADILAGVRWESGSESFMHSDVRKVKKGQERSLTFLPVI